jgi:transcriptional regulator with XRE-family HTH domain
MGHRKDGLHTGLAVLVGQRIRKARMEAGLSQHDLEPMGWNQGLISSWENGHKLPELSSIYLLAGALKVDPRKLLPAPRELGN